MNILTTIFSVFFLFPLWTGIEGQSSTEKSTASLNEKVLAFSQENMGKKIGRGECWDLAENALAQAGAKTSGDFGKVTLRSNYQWGKEVSLDQAIPGDVIQYKKFGWTKTTVETTGNSTSTQQTMMTYPHHTAILVKDMGNGTWEVHEQNSENKRFVISSSVHLGNVSYKEGSNIKVDITTSGRFWVYRPMAK